jgi:hypothetical protein
MWQKPEYEIVETCCEIGAYTYTEEALKKQDPDLAESAE